MSTTLTRDAVKLDEWLGHDVEALAREWRVPSVSVFRRIASTNDEARTRAAAGCAHGAVVIAEEQTAGRGRGGAAWSAPAGSSLLLSIVLRPAAAASGTASLGALPVRAGLAVARAVHDVAGVRAGFKWPNDLQVHGRKLAGILCEGALDSGGGFVVCGVGINVSQTPADFPADVRAAAVSLHGVGAANVDRVALAAAVAGELMHAGAGLAPLSTEELEELAHIDVLHGQAITVDGSPAGIADGIAADGALRVRNGARVHAVYSGTVRLTSIS